MIFHLLLLLYGIMLEFTEIKTYEKSGVKTNMLAIVYSLSGRKVIVNYYACTTCIAFIFLTLQIMSL